MLSDDVDDVMLTCDDLASLSQAATSFQAYLKSQGWEVKADKIQGPGQSVQCLGTIRLRETQVMREVVIHKIRARPVPNMVKELQAFVGLLGYWRPFIPNLTQILRPFYALVKKGS